MRGIPWKLLAAAALTAILLDLPFPIAGPLPLWRTIFAWFALVPLLAALLRLEDGHKRRRWLLGWSFVAGWLTGALWFGANCYWVYDTMHLYGGMDKPMAVVCLVAFSLYLGFWFGLFALALAIIRRATAGRKFAWIAFASIPFLWTAMEFALARIPEFPWDLLGYSQVDNAQLMWLAPWTGVYGISFVLALVNVALARAATGPRMGWPNWLASGTGLALLALGFLDQVPKPQVEATAVLVQPNLDVNKDDVWVGPEWDRQIAQFGNLGAKSCSAFLAGMPETGAMQIDPQCAAPSIPPSLIVWPESPAPFRDSDPTFRSAMADIARVDKAPIIVGNVGLDDGTEGKLQIYNSASVVTQDGRFAGRYDKIHLVPFGEYVPFRRALFFIHQIAQNMTDMSTGTERKVFTIGGHRYGVFICYESVFGDEIRQFARNGAEALVNISDDGWYGDTSAPWQHLNMARMRAIENRRWILRDTNNGVTASIDPYGTVRQSIPRHQANSLAAGYGFNSELTFYTVHGDWLAWICAVVALGLTGWAMRGLLLGKS
jgi:apolipoprotein N-acyltransferase